MSSTEPVIRLDVITGRYTGVQENSSLLLQEAVRQLDVCNACRYCEGLCAVFPALARRAEIDAGDVTQLANLCHDCRACYDACMYSPPHEFELDLPKALSAVRLADYQRYVWPARVPKLLSGWRGLGAGAAISTLLVGGLAVAHAGWSGLVASTGQAAGPYRLIPYGLLLALMLAATVYAVVVMVAAGGSYWREVGTVPGSRPKAVLQAAWHAATLRYMRGGGEECYYPDDEQPASGRRHLHGLVAWGFGLCVLSTIAAGISQDIFGSQPPYPLLSVPVLAGTLGGIGLVIGCAGLLVLKTRSSEVTSFAAMTVKDYGLLVALTYLGVTGIAVLVLRDTAAYGIVLLIHLSAVVEALAMAPYSKFVHIVFRFMALVHDSLEQQEA